MPAWAHTLSLLATLSFRCGLKDASLRPASGVRSATVPHLHLFRAGGEPLESDTARPIHPPELSRRYGNAAPTQLRGEGSQLQEARLRFGHSPR